MTDNEIIKALECCSASDCNNCPYDKHKVCGVELSKDALDLINRQQAEIERLSKGKENADEALASLKREYVRLQNTASSAISRIINFERIESAVNEFWDELLKLRKFKGTCRPTLEELLEYIEQAKSEAVKEFAELVKMEFYKEFDELIPSIMADKIDNLVKEMTESVNYGSSKTGQ